MPPARKYPPELRERSVRLVVEAMAEDSGLSMNAAVRRIAERVGIVPDTIVPDTLRGLSEAGPHRRRRVARDDHQ
jgi:transposase